MSSYAFPAPGGVEAPRAARPRLRAAIALGASLAPRGPTVKIALAVAALTTLGACVTAVVLAAGEAGDGLVEVAAATSSALAWTAGILVAVPASVEALRYDRRRGIRALLLARGVTAKTYARGRVAGLAAILFGVVGGGTLIAGCVAFLAASRAGAGARAFEGLIASLAYVVAYVGVVAPLAFAVLGARPRAGGFVTFIALLVVPELAKPWTSDLVPPAWGDLLGLPSALSALRASLAPHALDPARFARAAFVLAAFAVLAFAFVQAEIAWLDGEPGAEGEGQRR